MQILQHQLSTPSSGTTRELISLHYGHPDSGAKVYIQASLHADEIPGMLVAHYLRKKLDSLDEAGLIKSEIILVPVANPIGLAQQVHGVPFGRFDLDSGINFNRAYPKLAAQLVDGLNGKLGDDVASNVKLIRSEAAKVLANWRVSSETESLKKALYQMAFDADIVLDLHCENQGVMHLYTGTPLATSVEPLARYLDAHAVLLARNSGDAPFDESCSSLWWELAEQFGPDITIPNACLAVTIELRGESAVSHTLAEADAQAIIDFLAAKACILLPEKPMPSARCKASPLAAVEFITAPHAGVLVFLKHPGDMIQAGEAILDLIDPLTGANTALHASVSGSMFATTSYRYAKRGMTLAKIAGAVPFRTGKLLTP